MAVVGIDFGTLHSLIGVARHRGIDIITNEVSNRATPSLVGFGPKQRAIGESAKTQEISNLKNTTGCLKRLLGRRLHDPEIQEIEKKFIYANLVEVDGEVGIEVNYVGERQSFSAKQLSAMYLAKLRDIAMKELKTGVQDIVISVPGWFTDTQRRALQDAATVAGLNTLRLINDTTATALGYGITKSDLPEADNPRHVAFIDVGHSTLSVAIVAFIKGQLTVKSTAYDRNLGGRDVDLALVKHFSTEFQTKYKIDVLSNPKATFRLLAGCERLKKVLSANTEAPINVENIMNDIDASSSLTREKLEELISDVLDRVPGPLERALKDSGLSLDQIDAVELVGGSTRIPAIRARISQIFQGKVLSTTLNQDEAIARGATFACAQLSPIFRVREFAVHDIQPYPVKVQWERSPSDPDEDVELLVFPKGNSIPSTKVLSFYRKEPFDVEAVYAETDVLPNGTSPFISKFTAKDIPADLKGDGCVKVKSRLNLHGIMSFESAYVEEIEEKEELPAPMDESSESQPPPQPKKKRIVKKKEIPFIATSSSLDKQRLEELRELENQMHAADKLVSDTEDRKNALEEYVYDMRGKLEDRYAVYVQNAEKEKFTVALREAEEWLYSEEGEDAKKSAYVARLDALKAFGDPVVFRYRENDERQRATALLRETLNNYMSQATSGEERFAHIEEKDKQSIVEKVATVQKWLDDQIARQAERPKSENPVLTSEEIGKKRDEVIYFSTPILTKPKPKPKTPAPGSGTQTPKNNETPETQNPPPPKAEGEAATGDAAPGPSEMDVD